MSNRGFRALASAAILGVACDDTGRPEPLPGPSGPAGRVNISLGQDSIEVGVSVTAVAVPFDAGGSLADVDHLPVSWSVTDTTVLRVSRTLRQFITLEALRPGTATLSARLAGHTATKVLHVIPRPSNGLPSPVAGGRTWKALAAGHAHTCGVTTAGEVYCWGVDDISEVGANQPAATAVPKLVPLPVAATAIASSSTHVCAVGVDRAAYCWGAGETGQLGAGTLVLGTSGVVRVSLPGPVIEVATGERHTCALGAAGEVYCWGSEESGELGGPQTFTVCRGYGGPHYCRVDAVQVETALRFTALAAGHSSTCGLVADGTAYCWGVGAIGGPVTGGETCRLFPRTGPGPKVRPCARTPQPVTSGSADGGPLRFTALSAREFSTCGLRTDGALLCWTADRTPAVVPGVSGVRSMSLGRYYLHSCAVTAADVVLCWGANAFGQLGVTGIDSSASPVAAVPPASPARDVIVGDTHTCSLTRSGQAVCWGNPRAGRLGRGN